MRSVSRVCWASGASASFGLAAFLCSIRFHSVKCRRAEASDAANTCALSSATLIPSFHFSNARALHAHLKCRALSRSCFFPWTYGEMELCTQFLRGRESVTPMRGPETLHSVWCGFILLARVFCSLREVLSLLMLKVHAAAPCF
uniref:Uncharacterized protein n=1 Tax=Ixodes ricinus TaxID=34613 RepID=A0A147BDQ1_IXORI